MPIHAEACSSGNLCLAACCWQQRVTKNFIYREGQNAATAKPCGPLFTARAPGLLQRSWGTRPQVLGLPRSLESPSNSRLARMLARSLVWSTSHVPDLDPSYPQELTSRRHRIGQIVAQLVSKLAKPAKAIQNVKRAADGEVLEMKTLFLHFRDLVLEHPCLTCSLSATS